MENQPKPDVLLKSFNKLYDKTLNSISAEYKISHDELTDKYKIEGELELKPRMRRVLDADKRCMGRKYDKDQCTRARKPESDYCLSHTRNLPHGRVDNTEFKPKEKGKRGRKKKEHVYENNDNYIGMIREDIKDTTYLVDKNRFVYSDNIHQPKFLGKWDPFTDQIISCTPPIN
jgi:hypothetical protein